MWRKVIWRARLSSWWPCLEFLHKNIPNPLSHAASPASDYLTKSRSLLPIAGRAFHPVKQLKRIKILVTQGRRINTLRTGDADLRFYITTVQDGWRKSAFIKRACFPCTIHLIMQYIEPVSEWSCWRMFRETWPHSELNFRHHAFSL